jgi:predicted nucleic acid-binding protein
VILIDSNIPMYLIGATHPNKTLARQALEQCIAAGERLVTDAEVLQEILHRYAAIGRRAALQPAFDALLGVVDDVFAIEREEVEEAKLLLLTTEEISARDALHVAVMRRHRISRIMSFDRAFDRIPGVIRVSE